GMVGADIEFICKKASMLAIREFIENKKNNESENMDDIIINEKHFEEAIQLVIKQNMIRK
ncbi:MAG: hypothetical protein HQ541_14340, partial [Mariniphaga sp.]|nr:hypothetical protein [Mariniphaga sp.]